MTRIAVIGPQLLHPRQPNDYKFGGPLTFRRPDISPLVAEIYGAAIRSAREFDVELSLPIAQERDPRAAWINAAQRLANANGVVAIFVGRSQAIPTEASLAQQMGLPLVIAAVDKYFTGPFEQQGVPIIDAQFGASGVARAIEILLGRGTLPGAPAY